MSQPKRYGVKQTHIGIKLTPMTNGEWVRWDAVAALAAEAEVLRRKVEWLQKASDLLIWDGEKWNVRKEILPR